MTRMGRPYDRPLFVLPDATHGRARAEGPSARRRSRASTARPTPQQLVLEFHRAFGLPVAAQPTIDVPGSLVSLRIALLREEVTELSDACTNGDLTGIADGIADVLYVVYGTAVTYGLDADALLAEVHRSNMSKLGPDGTPIVRDDGKVVKGPRYSPPNFDHLLGLLPVGARGERAG